MRLRRTLRHLFTPPFAARRTFPAEALAEIEAAIGEAEAQHSGEIRFAVETALGFSELWRNVTPREHALAVFAELGVWDTEANNGVLILLCLADRDVEIVADRGAAERIAPEAWERVCREMEAHYRQGRFREGSLAGVRGVSELLARHFPPRTGDRDELPNRAELRT